MKYAVYVEGKAEMLFVADVLQKYSSYDPQKVGFICINLNADTLEYVNFPQQGDVSSQNYYQIVNVNNDRRVISKLKSDMPRLISQGYNIILGLRDVFGKDYEAFCPQAIVDMKIINVMHAEQSRYLVLPGADCRLHYAIMEYETWMLYLIESYLKQKGVSLEKINKDLHIDLSQNIELKIYHPYNVVQMIYKSLGDQYGKHEANHFSFLSTVSLEDYESLRISQKCSSFTKFLDSLLGSEIPVLP